MLGTIMGIGLLIVPYFFGKMGAGDAKLLGAVGSFIGYKSVFITFLLTGLAGGIYALLIIILYKSKYDGFLTNLYYSGINFVATGKFVSFENKENARQRTKLCYGLAIAAGTGIFMIFEVAGIKVLPL
jgi:prepilin peptidase CpaA